MSCTLYQTTLVACGYFAWKVTRTLSGTTTVSLPAMFKVLPVGPDAAANPKVVSELSIIATVATTTQFLRVFIKSIFSEKIIENFQPHVFIIYAKQRLICIKMPIFFACVFSFDGAPKEEIKKATKKNSYRWTILFF